VIKKPNKKRRKDNKTLSQKSKKRSRKKNLTKGNKRKEPKIKVLAHELLLSNASSLVIHQSFKYLFTDFSYIKFDRPLPLFLLPVHLITPLRIGASAGLRCICLNYLKRCCMSFSSTSASPSLLCMSSFQTRSLLVWPQIHSIMRISATFSCWTCCLLVG
jgi:hypothetical protein